jgi:hypothetical protein
MGMEQYVEAELIQVQETDGVDYPCEVLLLLLLLLHLQANDLSVDILSAVSGLHTMATVHHDLLCHSVVCLLF